MGSVFLATTVDFNGYEGLWEASGIYPAKIISINPPRVFSYSADSFYLVSALRPISFLPPWPNLILRESEVNWSIEKFPELEYVKCDLFTNEKLRRSSVELV